MSVKSLCLRAVRGDADKKASLPLLLASIYSSDNANNSIQKKLEVSLLETTEVSFLTIT